MGFRSRGNIRNTRFVQMREARLSPNCNHSPYSTHFVQLSRSLLFCRFGGGPVERQVVIRRTESCVTRTSAISALGTSRSHVMSQQPRRASEVAPLQQSPRQKARKIAARQFKTGLPPSNSARRSTWTRNVPVEESAASALVGQLMSKLATPATRVERRSWCRSIRPPATPRSTSRTALYVVALM
jgi:hypothetical protein